MTKRTCKVDGCWDPVKGYGMCSKHYQRWRKRGTTDRFEPPSELDRFLSKFQPGGENSCWEWQGTMYPNGYGMFALARQGAKNARYALAHRYSYEHFVGQIPGGLVLDHLCRNRGCVNPAHLEPVTTRENLRRGEGFVGHQMRRTHCKRSGHPLAGENLYVSPEGYRSCRQCARDNARLRRLRGSR